MKFSDFMIDSDDDSNDQLPAAVALTTSAPPAVQREASRSNSSLHEPQKPDSDRQSRRSSSSSQSMLSRINDRLNRSSDGERVLAVGEYRQDEHSNHPVSPLQSSHSVTYQALASPAPAGTSRRTLSIHESLHQDAQSNGSSFHHGVFIAPPVHSDSRGASDQQRDSGNASESPSAVEPKEKKKRGFNKALFERLSKPLASHQRYDEQQRLLKEQQAAEEEAEVQRQKDVLAPVTEAKWETPTPRFRLSDLAEQIDTYHGT